MLGRGTWNRTTVSGFGDPRTNRCTIPLYCTDIVYQKIRFKSSAYYYGRITKLAPSGFTRIIRDAGTSSGTSPPSTYRSTASPK